MGLVVILSKEEGIKKKSNQKLPKRDNFNGGRAKNKKKNSDGSFKCLV